MTVARVVTVSTKTISHKKLSSPTTFFLHQKKSLTKILFHPKKMFLHKKILSPNNFFLTKKTFFTKKLISPANFFHQNIFYPPNSFLRGAGLNEAFQISSVCTSFCMFISTLSCCFIVHGHFISDSQYFSDYGPPIKLPLGGLIRGAPDPPTPPPMLGGKIFSWGL